MYDAGVDNPTSYAPQYRQVADMIRRAIETGQYRAGDELPSTVRLQEQFNVSQGTIRGAMKLLKSWGLVDVPGPGRPTMVRQPPTRIVREGTERYQREKDLVLRGGLPADTHLAREVGLPEDQATVTFIDTAVSTDDREMTELLRLKIGEPIRRYSFLISAGAPGRIAHHYYAESLDERVREAQPSNAVTPGSAIWPGGAFYQLAMQGIEPDQVVDRITTRMPMPEEVAALRLPGDNIPLLCVRKVTFDVDRRPREVVDILMPGDRAECVYRIKLDRWPSAYRPACRDDSDGD